MKSNVDDLASKIGLRQLGTNIGSTLARQLFSLALGIFTISVIARQLGPVGNGYYAIALLLPTTLSTLLNLGIGPANVYHIGGQNISLPTALQASIRIWLLVSSIGIISGLLIIHFFSKQFFPGVPVSLLWLTVFLFPLMLGQEYLASLLQGIQNFQRFNIAILITPVTLFLSTLFLVLLERTTVTHFIYTALASQMVGILSIALLLKPLLTAELTVNPPSSNYIRQAVIYGYKAHLSNILAFINYRADVFLVNLLINPAAAGIYVISVTVCEKLWILSQAVSTVLLPRLSQLHTDEKTRLILTPLIARWVLIFTTMGAIFLFFTSELIIVSLFSHSYIGAVTPLLFMLPGIVVASMARILANDIAARGRPELNMYTSIIVVTVNILGNLLLIPRWGLSGAAIATTIAYSINLCFRLWIHSRLSGSKWHINFIFNSDDIQFLKTSRDILCARSTANTTRR